MKITDFLKQYQILIIRIGLGIIFLWFGILKIFEISPVLDLVAASYPFLSVFPLFNVLGFIEVFIGFGLLAKCYIKPVLWGMLLHLCGTMILFFFRPSVAFSPYFPILTIEGEFILKNIVLIAAGLLVLSSMLEQKA